jgi:hypothetical protein
VSVARKCFCWTMIVWLPLSLSAANTKSAVVHSKGGVWLNGSEAADATAVFPGDMLETKPGFVAELDADGSSVLIQPESIVKFEGTFLILDHGSVTVGTSTAMSVHVNCLRVEPVSTNRTQYDVTDVNANVQVAAHKNDVNITKEGSARKASSKKDLSQSATVPEGQQATKNEFDTCGGALRPTRPGTPLNAKWLEIGGGAAGGAVALCLILCKSPPPNSISPSQP